MLLAQSPSCPSVPCRNSAKGSPRSARPREMGTASTGPWATRTWSPCWGRAGRSSSECGTGTPAGLPGSQASRLRFLLPLPRSSPRAFLGHSLAAALMLGDAQLPTVVEVGQPRGWLGMDQ